MKRKHPYRDLAHELVKEELRHCKARTLWDYEQAATNIVERFIEAFVEEGPHEESEHVEAESGVVSVQGNGRAEGDLRLPDAEGGAGSA